MNAQDIKQILQAYHIAPLKSLGQHFLINEQAIHKVIHIAQITSYDTIIEIGSGLGVLTQELASQVKQLVAVEIDKGFFSILKDRFGNQANVKLVHQDILAMPLPAEDGYKVVGNLPYNISPHILEKFLIGRASRPALIVATVQKEFAQRVSAKPGKMNRIGAFVQYHGIPEIVAEFPPHYFWPQPKVHSSLLKIIVKPANSLKLSTEQEHLLWQLLKIAFTQPRKRLSSSLRDYFSPYPTLPQSLIHKRPQETSIEDWIMLASLS